MKPSRLVVLFALLALASTGPAVRGARAADVPLAADPTASARGGGASQLYEKALIEYNLGQTRAAYIHLKNALLEDPFLLSAHLLLGKIYIQLGFGEKAEKELLIADGLGADQSMTLIPLARAYLLQGKADQLIAELFPQGTLPEEDAELLALRGQAHLQLEQLYEAQRAFTQAWERNPNSLSAILGRVQVLLLKGDLNEADFYARRAAELAPDNARVWYLKGTLSRSMGDTQTALGDFERATKILPAHLPAQIARVSALLDLGRLDQATAAVGEVRQIYPRDPRSYYLDAVVKGRRGDTAGAYESLKAAEALLSQMPRELIEGHPPTLLLGGMVSYSLKRWAQAINYLSLYLQKFPDSVGPRTLLAQIYLDRHQEEEAVKLLEPAQALSPGDRTVLSLLAEAYMRQGQHVKASQLLQLIAEVGDDNVVLRVQRAVNQFALGRKTQAIEDLGAVFDSHPRLQIAGATLVVMDLKDRRLAEAVAAARRLLESDPQNLTFLNLYGVAQLAAGDLDAARWAFELALTLDWRFVPAQLNLAELDLRSDHPDTARERLNLIVERNPDQVSAMLMMARALEAKGLPTEARQWAERAVGTDPGAVQIAVYLTNLLLKMKNAEDALRVAESMEVRAADPDDLGLLAALSRAYIANGRRATAQTVLQRGSSLAGYDAPSLLEIANLQRQAGDLNGAIWSLEKAVRGQPAYLPTRIKLGELYTETGKLDDAQELAKGLARDFPKAPYGEHLMGLVAEKRGQNDQALAHFLRALKLEDSPVLAVRAYETLRSVQGVGPAIDFLVGWLAKHPDDAIARQALAEGLFRAGRSADAQAIYRKALRDTPDDPMLLNNLAIIYARERGEEALKLARRARELAPASPEIADTLGWVLVLQGQVDEGLKLLRDARARSADDPEVAYHIAYALDGLGRQGEAWRVLTEGLRSDSPFPEREEAEKLARRLDASQRGGQVGGAGGEQGLADPGLD